VAESRQATAAAEAISIVESRPKPNQGDRGSAYPGADGDRDFDHVLDDRRLRAPEVYRGRLIGLDLETDATLPTSHPG
jgi:hypothetical protein